MKSFLTGVRLWVCNHLVALVPFWAFRRLFYTYIMRLTLGERSVVLTECRFAKGGNVILGVGAIINNGCVIDNRGLVTIGRHASISFGTRIYTMGHVIDAPDFAAYIKPVAIGEYTWICADVIIQPGVTIGAGAVVLPGSVVASDVEPFAVVGGVPARFIRSRSRDLKYTHNWNPMVPPFG